MDGFSPDAFKKFSGEGKEKTGDAAPITEEELSEIKSPEYRPLKLPEAAMTALRKKLLRKKTTSDAQVHAPKGGVTVKGKKFIGGQFIPKEGGYQEAFLKQTQEKNPAQQEAKPEKPAAIKRASFSDYKLNSYRNLTAITKKPLSSPPRVKGNLSSETAKAIVGNARSELEKYSHYLSTASYGLARDSIYGMENLLSDPSLSKINAEHIDRMMIDSIRKMVNQEVESNRQQFTDHGIRHIQGNIDRMNQMLDTVNEGKTTAMEKLMGYFIMINHDVGYTAPEVRKGGDEGIKASKNHRKWSADILERQRNEWNRDKIFSPEQYDRIVDIVKTHDDPKIDKKDILGTSVRLADNLALFAKEKLPTMFSAIPKGKDLLIKMGEASQNKDENKFKEYRNEMYKSIDGTEMNANLKRDLKSAVREIGYMTPHFTLGVLAGEINKIDGDKNHINIDIQHNKWDSFLQKYFDMGQYQTRSFLKAYGITDFSKSVYNIGGFVTLRVKGYGTHDTRMRDEEWYIATVGGGHVEGPFRTKEEARMNLRYAETAFKTKKNPYGGGYVTEKDEIIATKKQLIEMGYGWHWGLDSKTADAQVHAPKGGVTLKGKKFKGGEFIPSEGGYAAEYEKMKKKGNKPSEAQENPKKGNKKEKLKALKEKISKGLIPNKPARVKREKRDPANAAVWGETKRDKDGKLVTAEGNDLPKHLQGIAIPPGYRDVIYNKNPKGDILYIGIDKKGKKQYKYSQSHRDKKKAEKFARVSEMGKQFNKILNQVNDDLSNSDAETKERALIAKLIMVSAIRPGGDKDTGADVKAYGAITLEARHFVEKEGKLYLDFIAKKGVHYESPINDKHVVSALKKIIANKKPDEKVFNTDYMSLLKYTKGLDGGKFKTKDFRTLLGTKHAIGAMENVSTPTNEKEYKKALKAVATVVAKELGNTPAVALQSYINPAVFAEWKLKAGVK